MLVENYSNSRSLQTHSAVEAIFSDLRVDRALIDRATVKIGHFWPKMDSWSRFHKRDQLTVFEQN